MSVESAGKHADQYGNVYQKGALISACLDLFLLKLSGNQYRFKDLKHDLGVKYGKDKFFEDAELFNEIEKLTYPEIREFLLKHVEAGEPIAYEKYFAMAGVQYISKETIKEISLGGIHLDVDSLGRIIVSNVNTMDAFGKKIGYQQNDELVSLNGDELTVANGSALKNKFSTTTKEGDIVKVVVRRKMADGQIKAINLSAPALKVEKTRVHQLKFDEQASPEQLALRRAWLNTKE